MAGWARCAFGCGISVDRRLTSLVLSEICTATVVIITAVIALTRLDDERSYMDRYVFAPLVDIGQALAAVDELHELVIDPTGLPGRSHPPILRLRGFLSRYERDWETGTSTAPGAIRLRAELQRQGESALIDQEHAAVGASFGALQALERSVGIDGTAPLDPPLRPLDVVALDRAVGRLNLINLHYVQIAHRAFERTHRRVTVFFFAISLAGIFLAAELGLSVRRAIGPRVRLMVEAVHSFREQGTIGPMAEGDDDLGQLAHALRLSFRGIAERDRERERFLAVCAHELKTPLSNLKGYAQAAIASRDDPALRDRALGVIDRQATRLARLAQDLLWSARAGVGQLPFHPAPLDLVALVRRVAGEVAAACPSRAFPFEAPEAVRSLGDAALLEQAVWNLLTQAATVASPGEPVQVAIAATPARAHLTVAARTDLHLPENLDELVQPFAALQYERRCDELRGTGLGLHLVREIARLHGATLLLEREEGNRLLASLELCR